MSVFATSALRAWANLGKPRKPRKPCFASQVCSTYGRVANLRSQTYGRKPTFTLRSNSGPLLRKPCFASLGFLFLSLLRLFLLRKPGHLSYYTALRTPVAKVVAIAPLLPTLLRMLSHLCFANLCRPSVDPQGPAHGGSTEAGLRSMRSNGAKHATHPLGPGLRSPLRPGLRSKDIYFVNLCFCYANLGRRGEGSEQGAKRKKSNASHLCPPSPRFA
jgi:hypothetical protein